MGWVGLVVKIRQLDKGDMSITYGYMAEENTGRMKAVYYHDESSVPALKNT